MPKIINKRRERNKKRTPLEQWLCNLGIVGRGYKKGKRTLEILTNKGKINILMGIKRKIKRTL